MKKMKRTPIIMTAILLAILMAFALPQFFISEAQTVEDTIESATETDSEEAHGEHTHSTTELVYLLDWNTEGVILEDGLLMFTNDLGYNIELHNGYLVTYSAELVTCEETSALDWLNDTFLPQTAHAGHGGDDPDQSKSTNIIVESLTVPESTVLDQLFLNETSYCNLHYLVGPGADYAMTPSVDELESQSLFLSGVYYAPNSEIAIPFEIETDLAWGQLNAIEELTLHDGHVQVTITRNLGSIFDRLDFAEFDAAEGGVTILQNLMDGLTVVIEK